MGGPRTALSGGILTTEEITAAFRAAPRQGGNTFILLGDVNAMIAEADKLMTHPAVRDAYEQFQTVCNLVKQKQNT